MKKNILISGIIAIISALIPEISAAIDTDNGYCSGMMSGFYGGYGTGFMLLAWVTSILIIILIVAAIYWLIKSANKKK